MLIPSGHTPIMNASGNMGYSAHIVVSLESALVFDNAKSFGAPMACSTRILREEIFRFSAFCSGVRGCLITTVNTPSNYGGNEDYVLSITNFGKQLFRANFNPLTKFLERDAFSELINSCNSVIIGTMRQQAK